MSDAPKHVFALSEATKRHIADGGRILLLFGSLVWLITTSFWHKEWSVIVMCGGALVALFFSATVSARSGFAVAVGHIEIAALGCVSLLLLFAGNEHWVRTMTA